MSTPKMGKSSQKPPHAQDEGQNVYFFINLIQFEEVSRISVRYAPGSLSLEVYYPGNEYPRNQWYVSDEDRRMQLQALMNRLALMEWPSLLAVQASAPLLSYFGPHHEVLRIIKLGRRAEIEILHKAVLPHLDPQTQQDVYVSVLTALNSPSVSAYDLELEVNSLSELAEAHGVEVNA